MTDPTEGLTLVGGKSQTSCGCWWQRTREYGDVLTVKCSYHARFGTMETEQKREEVMRASRG